MRPLNQPEEKSGLGGCMLILLPLLLVSGGAAAWFMLAAGGPAPPEPGMVPTSNAEPADVAVGAASTAVAPAEALAVAAPNAPAVAVTAQRTPGLGKIGSQGLATWKQTGWSYPGVVAEIRADQVLFVFADGMSRELPASELRGDTLTPTAQVTVTLNGSDRSATIEERRGDAVRVAFKDDLSVHWRALISIKVRAGDQPGEPMPIGAAVPGDLQPGRPVLAVWPKDGKHYPAQVIDRRGDGHLFILFQDGTSAWQSPAKVRPETLTKGMRAMVLAGPAKGSVGTVTERVAFAVKLRLDHGEEIWTALSRLRLP